LQEASENLKRQANATVAVATVDRPDDLAACLAALFANDTLPAEVIVVDQSPTRSAQAVISRFTDKHPSLIYVHQNKRGLSASRNAALERATFPIIIFIDDDCLPHINWISAFDKAFGSPPLPDAVSGRVLSFGSDQDLHSVSLRESMLRVDFCGKHVPWNVGTGGNFAAQRAWFDRIGMFNEGLGAGSPGKAAEDADMIYRLLREGARIRYEPDVLVYHKQQSREKRLSSRWGYGYGIGAFCGLWLRRLDPYILFVLLCWIFNLSRELAGLTLKREWLEARQRVFSLRGTFRGFLYSFTRRAELGL
jgi:GT2 family glycosyltransferase